MESYWKAWTDTTTEQKVTQVAERLAGAFAQQGRAVTQLSIAPYEKTGGHVLSFTVELESVSWADVVLELLATAQRVGNNWSLAGYIHEEVEATTSSTSIPGVTMLLCSLRK